MSDEKQQQSDSDWVRLQRLESDRRAWLWSRLKSLGGWTVGSLTALWAGIDAVNKFVEWVTKK